MYDLIDRPVADLPAFEQGLLMTTRRWAHAFSLAGVEPTLGDPDDALGQVMRALDSGSSEDIVIRRPCFSTVDEWEAVILGLWRLVRDRLPAHALAAALVDDAHVSALLGGMERRLGR